MALRPTGVKYQQLRRFPSSHFDLSVIAGPRASITDVQAAMRTLAGGSLLSIEFLRDFALPTADRSLSYRRVKADNPPATADAAQPKTVESDGLLGAFTRDNSDEPPGIWLQPWISTSGLKSN